MQESKKPGEAPTPETPEEKALRLSNEAEEQKKKDAEKAELKAIEAAQTRIEKDGKKETSVRSNLLPKESERHLFHVELDTPAFDPKTGKKLSKEKVQIFNPNEFSNFEKNAVHLGLTMKILWNPKNYKQ